MDSVKLTILDAVPQGFLDVEAPRLHELFDGPTLIHLPGRRPEPLFVSILLHGNEISGLKAIQQILKKYADKELPRALSILVGNIEAARLGKRLVPGQADYNRIWGLGDTPEHRMTHEVCAGLKSRKVFAAIDIHNNTGRNPHYALICDLASQHCRLATLFSRTVVYARKPDTTSTWAMAELCPAVTLECGLPGEPAGIVHATEMIDACLRLSTFPDTPVSPQDIDLFHTVAIVKIPPQYTFSFDGEPADIHFDANLTSMNFHEMQPGTPFCHVSEGSYAEIEAWDEHGRNRADQYFLHEDNRYTFRVPVMPAMLTPNPEIVRVDCLCYLMERIRLDEYREAEEGGVRVQTS